MVVVEEMAGGGCVVRSELAYVEMLAEETELFRVLFELADADGDGVVSESEGRAFLRRGLMSEAAVDRVWRLSSACCDARLAADDYEEGQEQRLDLGGFLVACKLVGLAQAVGAHDTADGARLESAIALSKLSDPLSDAVVPKIADFSMRQYDSESSEEGLVVKVMSPQLKGEGMSQHTVYAVRTRTSAPYFSRRDFRVYRRFSDFEWCHDRLRRSSPGVVVPPLLSPKRWTNNTHHDFVRDRMESLTRFANRVAAHPRLRRSLELMALLDASTGGLEAVKRLEDGLGLDPVALARAATRAASRPPALSPCFRDSEASGVESLLSCPSHSGRSGAAERASAWMSFLGDRGRKLGSAVSRAARDVSELWLSTTPSVEDVGGFLSPSASPYKTASATASTALGRKLARLGPGFDRALNAAEALVKHKRNAAYEASRAGHYLAVAVGSAPPEDVGRDDSDALLARLGETLELVASAFQDHVDHEVSDLVEQIRYQRALNAAGIDACRDRRKAAEATRRADDRAERAIQEHASARSTLDSRSSRVHVANIRRLAAVAARNAAIEEERAVEDTLAAEARRLHSSKFAMIRDALDDHARANLAFLKISRSKWQTLLNDLAVPTDAELTDQRRRLFQEDIPAHNALEVAPATTDSTNHARLEPPTQRRDSESDESRVQHNNRDENDNPLHNDDLAVGQRRRRENLDDALADTIDRILNDDEDDVFFDQGP